MSEIIGYDSSNVLQRLAVDSGKIGVSSLPALPAGENAIGKLAANADVNIGEVSVSALPALAVGSNAIGKLAANADVNIGEVSVSALPALVVGSAKVGQVGLIGNEAADGSGTDRYVLVDSAGNLQVDVVNTVGVTSGKSATVTENINVSSVSAAAKTALSDSTELDLTNSRDLFIYGDSSDASSNASVRLWVSSTAGGTYYGTSEVGVYDLGELGFKINDLAAKYGKLEIHNNGAGAADFVVHVAQM
jgi:hypothetical protein